jgi:hypothetical protein
MLPTTSLLQLAVCLSTFGRFVAASPGQLPGYDDLIARQADESCMFTLRNIPIPGTQERTTLTDIDSGYHR